MLEITDLKKSFRTPEGRMVEVVNLESFTLAAGVQAALRGVSGSGKTTLLNLIAGIVAADSGTVRIDGAEMTSLPEAGRGRVRGGKKG